MELEIEDQAFRLLALRQPVATDLRLIVATMRIATTLERIGDQGVNIAERALELNSRPPVELTIDLKALADLALGMVRTSIEAFVQQDPKLAIQVCQRDSEVDLLDDEYTQKILDSMIAEYRWVTRLHHFIIIVRNLERIADLATNIAEDIVFIIEGRVIRHRCADWMPARASSLTLAWAIFSSKNLTSSSRRGWDCRSRSRVWRACTTEVWLR
jgi:phosphate transport system protein